MVTKTAVEVNTQEKWDFVTKILEYNWIRKFKDYGKESCINIHTEGSYDKKWYQRHNHNVISFQEFCDLKNISNPFKPQYELW